MQNAQKRFNHGSKRDSLVLTFLTHTSLGTINLYRFQVPQSQSTSVLRKHELHAIDEHTNL